MINIAVTTESTKGNMIHLNASRDVRRILPVGDTLFLVTLTISHVIRTHRMTTMNGRGQISMNIHLVATCNVSNPKNCDNDFYIRCAKSKEKTKLNLLSIFIIYYHCGLWKLGIHSILHLESRYWYFHCEMKLNTEGTNL